MKNPQCALHFFLRSQDDDSHTLFFFHGKRDGTEGGREREREREREVYLRSF
jgi:hypothetical protein